ncbi:hypothetical protein [Nostoc sp.]
MPIEVAKEAEKTRLWHNVELKLVRFLNYCAKFCVAIALIFLPQEYGLENEKDEMKQEAIVIIWDDRLLRFRQDAKTFARD